jgi:hypothetical protein
MDPSTAGRITARRRVCWSTRAIISIGGRAGGRDRVEGQVKSSWLLKGAGRCSSRTRVKDPTTVDFGVFRRGRCRSGTLTAI